MHNIRRKYYPNGKIQEMIYLDTVVSTSDGLDKELAELRKKLNSDNISESDRILYFEQFKNVMHLIDKREDFKIHEDELEGEQLEFYQECKEESRMHSQLNNYKRAKNKIFDYARSNEWEYFVTFTFDPKKVNRSDYDDCKKKLTKFLNNLSQRYCDGELKYLVVPELHSDGINYHFHGLLGNTSGITFEPTNRIDKEGRTVYIIPQYKLGRFDATKISSPDKVQNYITKYCTKQLDIKLKGKRRYLVSNNLNLPIVEKVYNGYVKDYIKELEHSDTVVWWQQKSVKVQGKEKKYIIVEIDERNEDNNELDKTSI